MGKKVSKSSIKICKEEKKLFNSLIEVLRPRVYITDSSNFNALVQELTGNPAQLSSYYPPCVEREASYYQNIHAIDMEDERAEIVMLEPSTERVGGSSELDLSDQSSSVDSQMLHSGADLTSFDIGQLGEDWLAYRDMEGWLLDIDDHCSFGGAL